MLCTRLFEGYGSVLTRQLSCFCLLWLLLACTRAAAQVRREDPHSLLLSEPTAYTSVLDGFVEGTLPDVRVALHFMRSHTRGVIAREHANDGDSTGGRAQEVAISRQVTNALALDVAVGVYRDLMVYLRVPLVLSDTRQLSLPSGMTAQQSDSFLRQGPGLRDEPVFQLPYQSATRSGLPGIEVGVSWGLANQYRTPYLPTWVVGLETRIDLGKPMGACTDRGGCDAGISRGTLGFSLDTRWSYRVRFVEPYLGLRFTREWATTASRAFAAQDGAVPDDIDTTPPSVQTLTLGAALFAWEDRARFQRLSLDLRGYAAYVSEGRDYSPLFDALGTTGSRLLSEPYKSGAGEVGFTGLTNVASYARFAAELAVATQAARYVSFRLGVRFAHSTTHVLTNAAACVAASGACSERVNPQYRPIIDLPGQRFLQVGDLSYDLFAQATGEF